MRLRLCFPASAALLLLFAAPALADPDGGAPAPADPAAEAPAPADPAAGGAAIADPAAEGLAIAKRCEAANDGFGSEEASLEMVLINASGDRVQRKLDMKTIEVDGEGDRSMLTFLWPPDIKGTKLLTHTRRGKSDQQWLYLSAMRRVKRISSRSQSGAFMGSEFAFEDLGGQEVSKYTWSLDGEESLGGRKVWRLTRVPTSSRSGYSKQVVWMDQQYKQPIKIDFYDRKQSLLKTLTAKGFARQGKWWRPSALEMVNHQTHKKSVLEWAERELEADLDEDEFDKDALED